MLTNNYYFDIIKVHQGGDTIIVKVESIPNNSKNTSIVVTLNDDDKYKVVMGRSYLYMIDYSKTTGYKVKHTITLLNLFSYTMSNVIQYAEELINTIKKTSFEQMEQNNLKRMSNIKL